MTEVVRDPALLNLLRYFGALEACDFEGALECFTDDVVYQHPPYGVAGHPGHEGDDPVAWNEARGKTELRRMFQFRGTHPGFTHHITTFARTGDVCFHQGFARTDGVRNEMTWVSVSRVNSEGLIAEYQPYIWRASRPIIGSDTPIH